jgi:hypothetical protein
MALTTTSTPLVRTCRGCWRQVILLLLCGVVVWVGILVHVGVHALAFPMLSGGVRTLSMCELSSTAEAGDEGRWASRHLYKSSLHSPSVQLMPWSHTPLFAHFSHAHRALFGLCVWAGSCLRQYTLHTFSSRCSLLFLRCVFVTIRRAPRIRRGARKPVRHVTCSSVNCVSRREMLHS